MRKHPVVEQAAHGNAERLCERSDHVERGVAVAVLYTGQVGRTDAGADGDLVLAQTDGLSQVTDAATEYDTRWFTSMQYLARHALTLRPHCWPSHRQGAGMSVAVPTLTDESDRMYLVLRVAIAHDHTDGAATQTRWCADISDPASPLAGLYAFAESLPAVRDAIAKHAWSAVVAGELRAYGINADTIAGIHVVTTTCDVYEATWLAAAVADDAA